MQKGFPSDFVSDGDPFANIPANIPMKCMQIMQIYDELPGDMRGLYNDFSCDASGNRVGVLSASRVRISPTPPKSRHPIWDAVIFCGAERFELKIGTVRWTVPAASANTGGFAYFCQRQKCKRISPTPPSRPPPCQCRRRVHNRPIRDFGEAKM